MILAVDSDAKPNIGNEQIINYRRDAVAYLEGCRWVLSTRRFLDMGAEHPSILSKISLDVGTFKKEILLIRTHYF